ncbi:hypothetical protein PGT21_003690 [Puccinia graminis f. sp. tritici]|uniref:Uncharacterized protein n=1 Tax=Puccinia graminis f. sp. tritici TaxID=56615 RepID=A0A5B0RT20_PUCGR|nr:hypothetical protein PGT21_003690 [Puccinia graminis f. sp. tritici]KAA1128482.1 hypothetical protein PGTUg99_014429 [Puccinia graminis f. sp. tritici]
MIAFPRLQNILVVIALVITVHPGSARDVSSVQNHETRQVWKAPAIQMRVFILQDQDS